MAAKKSVKTGAPPAAKRANPDAFEIEAGKETRSQSMARVVASGVLSAATLKQFSGAGETLEIPDLVAEMKRAGDEAVAGDMGRVERMLANQVLTLDMLFNNLAQRSGRQDTFKGIEVLMRLALKAQAQARVTAEALAVIKNPAPYIRQANLRTGHQQVNNGTSREMYAHTRARAEDSETAPNKLLEAEHGQRLDIGAQAAPGRANPHLATVG